MSDVISGRRGGGTEEETLRASMTSRAREAPEARSERNMMRESPSKAPLRR